MMTVPHLPHTYVVGLGNKARHGKDTVANRLVQVLGSVGVNAKRYSFAQALYDHCRVTHGMADKDAPLLQRVGVAMREEKDLNVWIATCFWRIRDEAPDVAIISDVRFPNEAEAVRNAGGLLIRVTRYNADGSTFVDPSRPADHQSETANDGVPFDLFIPNKTTLEALDVFTLDAAAKILYRMQARLRG